MFHAFLHTWINTYPGVLSCIVTALFLLRKTGTWLHPYINHSVCLHSITSLNSEMMKKPDVQSCLAECLTEEKRKAFYKHFYISTEGQRNHRNAREVLFFSIVQSVFLHKVWECLAGSYIYIYRSKWVLLIS